MSVFTTAQPLECSRCSLQAVGPYQQGNTKLCSRDRCDQFVVKVGWLERLRTMVGR